MSERAATTIRQPSTANLMIDSLDRPDALNTNAGDFQITKQYSILNGFFTRIGTTEVVLEWNLPNISMDQPWAIDGTFSVLIGATPHTVTVTTGNYTVQQCLDEIVSLLNAVSAPAVFSIGTTPFVSLDCTANFTVVSTNLSAALGFEDSAPQAAFQQVGYQHPPNIQGVRYIDFLSPTLTYNQDLKDATTMKTAYDVLCRWYMANTDSSSSFLDGYGFPLYPGYMSFHERRLFNPPKQIKWDPIQVLGNLSFQVYFYPSIYTNAWTQNQATLPLTTYGYEWLMSLQVSEN